MSILFAACDSSSALDYDGPVCADAWVTVADECDPNMLANEREQCISRNIWSTFSDDDGCDGECAEQRGQAYRHVSDCVWDVSGVDVCLDARQACGVE
jgi:hypothetical protein